MKGWYRDSISFQLLRAARMHRTRAAELLGEIDLHPGQENVLLLLSEVDSQPMTLLAESMGVQPPTVTKMIARMSAQGLVTRTASNDDGRKFYVALTDEGRRSVKSVKKLWKTLEKEAITELGKDDRKHLATMLREMASALAGEKTRTKKTKKKFKAG